MEKACEQAAMSCNHSWEIDYSKDGVSWGHCKKCPATRGFLATMPTRKRGQIHLGFKAGKT
jgi:hypothetical protein